MSQAVNYEIGGSIGAVSVDNPPVKALSQAVRQGLLDAVSAAQDGASEAVVLEIIEREAKNFSIDRRDDIDVVYVHGHGFPVWRGGPMHYADTIGLKRVHERVSEFRDRFGVETRPPAPLLAQLAESR
jgi:3-hydroxyacyl-CoA dehydrogenase